MASQLVKKLRIQPGQRMLVLNPPPGYIASLGDLPAGAAISEQPGDATYDFVQVFAKDQAELDRLKVVALAALVFDGLFWACYPKKTSGIKSDLTRDSFWNQFEGLRPVAQVAIDDTWSALRFRPAELVNT